MEPAGAALRSLRQQPPARESVRDGVFTAEQVKRGQMEYDGSCGSCHLYELQGDEASDVPPLAGPDFLSGWRNRSVRELFDFVSTNMPVGRAGALDKQAYLDILVYVLNANGFPAGQRELALDPARLDRIVIEEGPVAGR